MLVNFNHLSVVVSTFSKIFNLKAGNIKITHRLVLKYFKIEGCLFFLTFDHFSWLLQLAYCFISRFLEKKTLDNSLIDLEFRFNELVTHEDGDLGPNRERNVAMTTTSNENLEFHSQIKNVVEKLEGKVQQMDEKISTIGKNIQSNQIILSSHYTRRKRK